jgi:hypothetical protein
MDDAEGFAPPHLYEGIKTIGQSRTIDSLEELEQVVKRLMDAANARRRAKIPVDSDECLGCPCCRVHGNGDMICGLYGLFVGVLGDSVYRLPECKKEMPRIVYEEGE